MSEPNCKYCGDTRRIIVNNRWEMLCKYCPPAPPPAKVGTYKEVDAEIDRINKQLSDFVQTVRRELVFTFRGETYQASWGMGWDYDGTLEPFFALKCGGLDARYLPTAAPNKEEAALLAKIGHDRVMQWVRGKAEFPETLADLVGEAKIEVLRKVEVRCIDELVEVKS